MSRALPVCALVALATCLWPSEARAQDPRCDPPQVLLVLDHSSSMGTRDPLADGSLKWTAAVTAVTDITRSHESSVDFGLMVFPSAGECTPGAVDVPVGPLHARSIAEALPGDPPYGGNYTPMYQSLDAAAEYAALRDSRRRNFVVLVTDGWQWCDPYDPATRFEPVASTEDLLDLGVTTYVVGFGDSVDSLALNRMAHTAGTALAGCDPTSEDPGRADNCYHQVDDLASLRAALDAIAREVSEEICDGLDNDCDGEIDEDLSRPCESVCGPGVEVCVDGAWTDCDAPLPEDEICDGLDNDCDGITDPNCLCIDGETMECGLDEGECETGLQSCLDGLWGDCEGSVEPAPEVCDGLDNDCDGAVDDGADCPDGSECIDGECVDVTGEPTDIVPPDGEGLDDAEAATGCACRASGGDAAGEGLLLATALLGLLALARRR